MSSDGDSSIHGEALRWFKKKAKQWEKDIQYMIQMENGNLLLGKWYGWAWKLDEIGI